MYSYITPFDFGKSREGKDDDADRVGMFGVGFLFDDGEETEFDPVEPVPGDFGQLIAPEQLEGTGQLTVEEAKSLGFGATATTLEPQEALLGPPPAGEKWELVGPSADGTGYDWKSVPDIVIDVPAEGTLARWIEKARANKTAVGIGLAALFGGLWWFFVRKRR